MDKVLLTVQESLAYAQETAYWDGYTAGTRSTADHAKQLALDKIMQSRKPTPPPAQPEPTVPEA